MPDLGPAFRCDENHPFLLQTIEDYKSIPTRDYFRPILRTAIDFGNIALRDGKREEAEATGKEDER